MASVSPVSVTASSPAARAVCPTAESDDEWIGRLTAGAAGELDAAFFQDGETKRPDKHLILNTVSGERRMRSLRVWHFDMTNEAAELLQDSVAGQTKLMFIVQLGDELNNRAGFVHGGFASALLDELFGWTAGVEFHKFMGGTKALNIFTANLNVNYRAPMRCDAAYSVEVIVEKIAKQKKVYMRADIRDAEGKLLVEGTSLYLIVRKSS